MNNNIIKMFIVFSLILIASGFVNAVGCCFNPSNGMCSMNSEESVCTNNGGEFYSSPSCSTTKCDRACCILGDNSEFITGRECQILSSSFGFSYPGNWQSMEENDCLKISQAEVKGACVYGDEYLKTCKYQTYSECTSGNFYEGVFCSAPELNTTCKSTTQTICYSDNVYGKDSCGNPDNLKSICSYDNGSVCKQTSIAGKSSAECKSLNCPSANLKNGQSICLFDNKKYSSLDELGKGLNPVGSRFFKKYCIDGDVVTEPCDDFRMSYCEPGNNNGEVKCENNPWQDCLDAGNDSSKCDSKYCYMYDASRAHCVSLGTTGFCTNGDDTTKWYPAQIDRENFKLTGSIPITKGDVMTKGGSYGGKSNSLISELNINMCLPKIAGGLDFSGSSKSTSSAAATCALGNFEAKVKLDWCKKQCYPLVWEVETSEDSYGNAALIDLNLGDWNVRNKERLNPINSNPLAVAMGSYLPSSYPYTGNSAPTSQESQESQGNSNPSQEQTDNWVSGSVIAAPITGNAATDTVASYNSYSSLRNLETTESLTTIYAALLARCRGIGDCDGKSNWVGEPSSAVTIAPTLSCHTTGNQKGECSFNFECVPFEAPSSDSNCKKCGADGLACSEYRCQSLGNCEYFEPDGADKSYCIANSDNVAPVIKSVILNPQSPVQPYTPVEITLTTDEASKCKFNLNKASSKFEEMEYDFGTGYSTEHKILLTLPGQTIEFDETTSTYDLINKDGKYILYARCIDPAGNGKAKPAYPVNFEVMTYPDTIAPSLSKFSPISGSRIKYNTTEKTISFQLNEPAQCKWDFQETYNIDRMKYNFSCDNSINENPLKNYTCTGRLTNITLALDNESTFYIRCKDQPWIENGSVLVNGVNYSRNEMQYAYVYKLRPSEKFKITEVGPTGLQEISSADSNITISALTEGGAFYGRAKCYWKYANTSEFGNTTFTKFKNSDSATNTQVITSPYLGDNYLQVKCQDDAENEDQMNASFNLMIDDNSPFINRVYDFVGKLRIKTDEDSLCYYSFDKITNCLFDINNATAFEGLYSKEHDTLWDNDKTYYIKCKDLFNNYDIGCGKIVRTY